MVWPSAKSERLTLCRINLNMRSAEDMNRVRGTHTHRDSHMAFGKLLCGNITHLPQAVVHIPARQVERAL